MFEINNFIKNTKESSEKYTCYRLNKIVCIFNSFVLEDVYFYVSCNLHLELLLSKIENYLKWLSTCETDLKNYYDAQSRKIAFATWFDDLEIYRIDITFNDANDYGATVSCEDQLFIDHIMEIVFVGERVTDIKLNC